MLPLGTLIESIVAVAAIVGIVVVPGYCVVSLLTPNESNVMVRLGYGAGIGMGLPALGVLWLRVLDAKWLGAPLVVAYVLAGIACFVWLWLRQGRRPGISPSLAPRLLLLFVLVAATISRLYATRDMAYGHLGDSLQHTVIAQLLVDNNGLFADWSPYAPIASFTYHYGFHTIAAMFHWLTTATVARSVVLVGQTINVLTILVAYSSATLLFRMRWRRAELPEWGGLIASLVPAFLSTQPAYYVNWGRYTQLAGQIILPLVGPLLIAYLAQSPGEKTDSRLRRALLFGLLLAGLFVTHYRVSLFAAAFVVASVAIVFAQGRDRRTLASGLRFVALIGGIGVALAAPWIITTWSGKLPALYSGLIQQTGMPSGGRSAFELPPMAPFYVKTWMAILAGFALLVAARMRFWPILHVAGWTGALLAFPTIYLLGLPGAGVIDWFSVYLALYIPLAFMVGFAGLSVAAWAQQIGDRPEKITLFSLAAIVVAATLWGMTFQPAILDESRGRMVSGVDVEAFDWIKQNTDKDASFLISGFPCFGGPLCGNDAGWWLTYVTGRSSSIPPLPYTTETTRPVDFRVKLQAFYGSLRQLPTQNGQPVVIDLTTPEAIKLIRDKGYTHVFIGDLRFPSGSDRLDADKLTDSPAFGLVYARGNARVYVVKPQP